MALYHPPGNGAVGRFDWVGVAGRAARNPHVQAAARWAGNRIRDAISNRGRTARSATFARSRNIPVRQFVRGNSTPSRYAAGSSSRRRLKRGRKRNRRRRSNKKTRGTSGVLSKLVRRLCTPMTYKTTYAQNGQGNQGLRSYFSLCTGGENLITTIGAKHPSNFLFNTAHGSSSTATLQDQGGSNWNLQLNQLIWDARIQNRSNASMELKMYECLVRHDISSSSLSNANQSLSAIFQQSLDTPTYVGQDLSNLGPGQAALPTGVSHEWQLPTFTPYMSNTFCTFFKIIRQKSMTLSPNEIVPMKFHQRKKLFKGSHIQSSNSYEWQKGWSKIILFTWVGMPIDDGTTSNQSKAKCDLFIQADVCVKYMFVPGTEPLVNFDFSNNLNYDTNTYRLNPTAFSSVIPASDTIEVVPGYTSTGGTTTATDTAGGFAP